MSQAPTNLSTYFYDTSCIALSFSDPSSAYFNSSQTYYYVASAVDLSGNKTTYATGTKSPIYIQGLSAGYSYKCSLYMIQTASSDSISFTTLSYPTISDISLTDVSFNFINLKWTGTDLSYVKVSRRIGTLLPYSDICGGDYLSPYSDSDISGNTTYYYYVTPYMTKYGSASPGGVSSIVSATTPVAYPTDVSATFVDISAIQLTFTKPKNSYTTSVYYIARVSYNGNTDISGTNSPILVNNLLSGKTYTCYILTYLDGIYGSISQGLDVTTKTIVYFSKFNLNTADVVSTTTSDYSIYVFKNTSQTYTINYTVELATKMYILAVGGGGGVTYTGGSGAACGGGGGGGVVKASLTIPTGSDSIVLTVGKGGSSTNNITTSVGSNTKLTFASNYSGNIIAYGGGAGGGPYSNTAGSGGSGGGAGGEGDSIAFGTRSTEAAAANNYGNSGGKAVVSTSSERRDGGGGGAGSAGSDGNVSKTINSIVYYGCGGDGIGHLDLSGICDYTPYSGYYWGGGGGSGGHTFSTRAGCGGLGGGGGGCGNGNASLIGKGGGSAINSGGDGGSSQTGGNGGTNTGGGAGGGYGSSGGSGIIIIAIPKPISSTIGTFGWSAITSLSNKNSFSTGNALVPHKCYSKTGQYVFMFPATPGTYGAQTLYRSIDYGQSFSQMSQTGHNSCCSDDGSIVWVVTYGGTTIYYSSDYGSTFTSTTTTYTMGSIDCTSNGLTVYTSPFSSGAQIMKITYSGGTFTKTNLQSSNYGYISCSSDGTKILAYNLNTAYYVSTNSGTNWTTISTLGTAERSIYVSANGTYMFTTGSPSYMSSNSGSTWTSMASVLPSGCSSISCSNDGKYILAGNYLSSNYGASFSAISSLGGIGGALFSFINYTGQYMTVCDSTTPYIYTNGNYGSDYNSNTELNSCTSLYSSIIVYYKFNDTSTSLIKDTIGTYNTTATNCILNVSGKVNNCINFNSAGYVTLSQSVFNNLSSYTIVFWIYLNALGTYVITSKQWDGSNTYAALSIGCYAGTGGTYTAGTAGYIYYHPSNSQSSAAAISARPLTIKIWYHVAVTCTSTQCLIYMNGQLSSTTSINCTLPNQPTVTNSYIGYWSGGGSYINGYMDDFAVFNTALSSTDIYSIYTLQK